MAGNLRLKDQALVMKTPSRISIRWPLLTAAALLVILPASICSVAQAAQAGATPFPSQSTQKPHVQPITSMRALPGPNTTTKSAHKQSYEITLKDSGWTDTGIVLAAGEHATFTATGKFTMADGRIAEPDGLTRGWKDLLRQFPLNSANVGALVGRVSDIGASVPFLIGAKNEVTMPTSGKLYLCVNATSDLAPSGSYKVKIKFDTPKPTVEGMAQSPGVAVVSGLVSPETFADIPRRVTDQVGNEGDMVNFALLGTQAQVEAAFKAAGWVEVDKNVQDAILHGLLATLGHEAYTQMPMSTLYLFGRPQDLSFARAEPLMVAAERHHLRVWKTTQTIAGVPLWVGSATHDVGFETDQRNGGVTHKIDPKIDDERDFLLHSFDAAGVFSSAAYVLPADPMLKAKTATGGSFYSDGRILVMELK
ncbi:MAG TPA: LssY C-terminal domain-containing protein [Edaphobacter sp.]|nr:LssY C-terminal domain-containing protein [Edaphobacter sp.]